MTRALPRALLLVVVLGGPISAGTGLAIPSQMTYVAGQGVHPLDPGQDHEPRPTAR